MFGFDRFSLSRAWVFRIFRAGRAPPVAGRVELVDPAILWSRRLHSAGPVFIYPDREQPLG